MTDGKTVQAKELPKGKTRLFKKREAVSIEIPQSLNDHFDEVPLTIEIKPMSHQQAELHRRLSDAVGKAEKLKVRQAGISMKDYRDYTQEAITINKALAEVDENGDLLMREKDIEKARNKFESKWQEFELKLASADNSTVANAQDELLENTISILGENVVSATYSKDDVEMIDRDMIECIHPEVFQWLLHKLEEISYLRDGEVLGLQ